MPVYIAARQTVPAPVRSDLGSGTYALAAAAGLFLAHPAVPPSISRLQIAGRGNFVGPVRSDIGSGTYALDNIGRLLYQWALFTAESAAVTLQMASAGGAQFTGTHHQVESTSEFTWTGIGQCVFMVGPDPVAITMQGVGGCWFRPSRRGFLQMDGHGRAAFNGSLRVSDLIMGGAGRAYFGTDTGIVSGTFEANGIGGMRIIVGLPLATITGDGVKPGGGAVRRWNYAF